MKSILSAIASAAALFIAFTGSAFADGDLPEPSSIGLTALGLGVAAFILAKGKRK